MEMKVCKVDFVQIGIKLLPQAGIPRNEAHFICVSSRGYYILSIIYNPRSNPMLMDDEEGGEY
jgi:hypothetical protein